MEWMTGISFVLEKRTNTPHLNVASMRASFQAQSTSIAHESVTYLYNVRSYVWSAFTG